MGRFLIIVCVVLLLAFAFYRGWFSLSGHSESDANIDKATGEVTVDKAKIKEDTAEATSKAKELGQKASEKTREAVSKIEGPSKSDYTPLALNKKTIELEQGAKTEVTVTRTGGDLNNMQLGLTVSQDCNLLVSGGLFKAGGTETTITVEAPKGARDGSITMLL
jgi:hypothetical protein